MWKLILTASRGLADTWCYQIFNYSVFKAKYPLVILKIVYWQMPSKMTFEDFICLNWTRELLLKSKDWDTQKLSSDFVKELEFARICQWDFVSFVLIFQFTIQRAKFQCVDLNRKFFDSFMYSFLDILTHAKTIEDIIKRVISYHSGVVQHLLRNSSKQNQSL